MGENVKKMIDNQKDFSVSTKQILNNLQEMVQKSSNIKDTAFTMKNSAKKLE